MTGADERGSLSVELALLTVPLVVIMLFVVVLGRLSSARNQVVEAARDGARAASLAYLSGATATSAATALVDQDLAGIDCSRHTISVDVSQLRPGGDVSVTVACQVPLNDLVLLRVPGSRTVEATSTSVIDTYVPG